MPRPAAGCSTRERTGTSSWPAWASSSEASRDQRKAQMTEIRVMAGNGCIGSGFKLESLRRGVELRPHVIACDAGSTDSGPAALGSGAPKLSREACKRDLRLLLNARDTLGVPLIIGSCGTSGRDVGGDW